MSEIPLVRSKEHIGKTVRVVRVDGKDHRHAEGLGREGHRPRRSQRRGEGLATAETTVYAVESEPAPAGEPEVAPAAEAQPATAPRRRKAATS